MQQHKLSDSVLDDTVEHVVILLLLLTTVMELNLKNLTNIFNQLKVSLTCQILKEITDISSPEILNVNFLQLHFEQVCHKTSSKP